MDNSSPQKEYCRLISETPSTERVKLSTKLHGQSEEKIYMQMALSNNVSEI